MIYEEVYADVIKRLKESGLSEEESISFIDKIIDENIKNHFIEFIKRMQKNSVRVN